MHNWSISSQEHIHNDRCGQEFKNLNCNKVYIRGDLDTPKETQYFLKKENIPNRLYKGIGHWYMVENSGNLYDDINSMMENGIEQWL